MVPSVVTSAAVCRSPIRPWSAMGGYRSMTVPQRVWRSGAENGSNAQQRQRGRVRATQRTPGCADRLPGQGQSISRSTRLPASRRENAAKISLTPRMIRYQATKIDTTYRVRPGQAKVTTAAATPKIPATMNSQRHSRTRAATASWVTPPNKKLTPTSAATAARLPTRQDSTYMPNQVHSTPRIRNHHQIADRSRTPARMVSRRVVDGGASLVIAGPLCSPLLAGPISRPPAGGGMAGHTLVPWCRRAGTVPKTTITVDGRRVSSQIQAPTRRRRSPRSGLPQVQPQLFTLISVSDHARGGSESLRRLVSRNTCAPSIAPAKDAAASGESLHLARGGSGRLRAGRLGRAGALGRRGARAGGIGRRARCGHRVDGLGELQDLVGQTQQLLVLLLLLLDRLPLVVGHDLALLVRAVLADQHKRRQEDGLQRDDHRQQPEGIVLDSEADLGGEPEHVDVHELHRPGEPGDLVGDAVLDVLRSLLGLLDRKSTRLNSSHVK